MNKIYHLLIGSMLCMGTYGCSDSFFDTGNSSVVTPDDIEEIEKTNPDALVKIVEPMLLGIYRSMTDIGSGHGEFGVMSHAHLGDMMTDDIAMHTVGNGWFTYDHGLEYWGAQYTRAYGYWNFYYTIINNVNDVMNKVSLNTTDVRLQAVLGQAYALRAFSYFQIIQMYQQTYVGNENRPTCPVYITSREGESFSNRVPLNKVMERIESDFQTAFEYLEGWERPSKIYINEDVAAGLYARVCMVKQEWEKAITYSKKARQNTPIFTIDELRNEGFNNISSIEWMWGAAITAETSTIFASYFSFMCAYDAGYGGDVGAYRKIDARLFESFSSSDIRRQQFKDPKESYSGKEASFPAYTNLKFKKVNNWAADYVYMRSAEMILMEAEALAHLERNAEASTALAQLMSRRDPSWSKSRVSVEEVYTQRRLELWGEGFSLNDRKRLHKGIERNYPGSNHLVQYRFNVDADSWLFFYQLPLTELDNNPQIGPGDQNPSPSESEKKFN